MQEVRHGNFEKYHCATTKKSKHDPSTRCQVDPSIASYLSSRATFLMTPIFSRERPWYAMIPREQVIPTINFLAVQSIPSSHREARFDQNRHEWPFPPWSIMACNFVSRSSCYRTRAFATASCPRSVRRNDKLGA